MTMKFWAMSGLLACTFAVSGCDDDPAAGGADLGVACSGTETRACNMNGMPGTETCMNGQWSECRQAGIAEACNGLDDDGNGMVDGLQRACNTACGSGVETCPNGAWIGCTAPEPGTEVCDGQDNDCDGQIDEGLTRVCENECGQGMERCSLGNWIGCDAPRQAPEQCNGMDDDCDGQTDENVARECSSRCGPGAEVCVNGQFGDCDARQPGPMELCNNDIDDDCNGETDEGCDACVPGSTTVCSVDRGVCRQGVKECQPDGTWAACIKDGQPVAEPGDNAEVCDGQDNDCDGVVDDNVAGTGEACGSDEGVCQMGVVACVDGDTVCLGEVAARDEQCDALDNDCDGDTDEDLPPDNFESNENCVQAENIGDLSEGGGEPRIFTGSVYPDGDVDYYMVRIEEANDLCVPFVGNDDAYQVAVAVGNLPEDARLRLCLTVFEAADTIEEACASEPDAVLADEFCTEEVEGGLLALGYTIEPSCGFNDDTHVLIKVETVDGGSSCSPYSVGVIAETVEPPPEE